MPISDEEERELRVAVMQSDLKLKQKQAFWETPRNLILIFGTLVAATAVIAGLAGYKLGQNTPPQQPIIIQLAPGATVVPVQPTPAK